MHSLLFTRTMARIVLVAFILTVSLGGGGEHSMMLKEALAAPSDIALMDKPCHQPDEEDQQIPQKDCPQHCPDTSSCCKICVSTGVASAPFFISFNIELRSHSTSRISTLEGINIRPSFEPPRG